MFKLNDLHLISNYKIRFVKILLNLTNLILFIIDYNDQQVTYITFFISNIELYFL
ncbi:hypothetical protein BN1088_140012 [Sphingobacterium sp. PM2-P1-29]|nr:hypothetical protein BN1088_140012 [Sphingobacterium sp. PM2-P1-29]